MSKIKYITDEYIDALREKYDVNICSMTGEYCLIKKETSPDDLDLKLFENINFNDSKFFDAIAAEIPVEQIFLFLARTRACPPEKLLKDKYLKMYKRYETQLDQTLKNKTHPKNHIPRAKHIILDRLILSPLCFIIGLPGYLFSLFYRLCLTISYPGPLIRWIVKKMAILLPFMTIGLMGYSIYQDGEITKLNVIMPLVYLALGEIFLLLLLFVFIDYAKEETFRLQSSDASFFLAYIFNLSFLYWGIIIDDYVNPLIVTKYQMNALMHSSYLSIFLSKHFILNTAYRNIPSSEYYRTYFMENWKYTPKYDKNGFDQYGYDKEGYDKKEIDKSGFDKKGYNARLNIYR